MPDGAPASAPDLLRQRDYLFFLSSRWLGQLGIQTQSVAMGWQVYDLSRRTLGVGASSFNVSLIGLITFAPLVFLTLPAGETADRYDRRRVLLICYLGEIAPAAVLAAAGIWRFASVPLLLGVAAIFGASRAFFAPANTALGPMLVPRDLLPRAIAWNSLAGQTATIAGPAIAGFLIILSPSAAYLAALGCYAAAWVLLLGVRRDTRPAAQAGSRWALMRRA
jgi:MFS family permease